MPSDQSPEPFQVGPVRIPFWTGVVAFFVGVPAVLALLAALIVAWPVVIMQGVYETASALGAPPRTAAGVALGSFALLFFALMRWVEP